MVKYFGNFYYSNPGSCKRKGGGLCAPVAFLRGWMSTAGSGSVNDSSLRGGVDGGSSLAEDPVHSSAKKFEEWIVEVSGEEAGKFYGSLLRSHEFAAQHNIREDIVKQLNDDTAKLWEIMALFNGWLPLHKPDGSPVHCMQNARVCNAVLMSQYLPAQRTAMDVVISEQKVLTDFFTMMSRSMAIGRELLHIPGARLHMTVMWHVMANAYDMIHNHFQMALYQTRIENTMRRGIEVPYRGIWPDASFHLPPFSAADFARFEVLRVFQSLQFTHIGDEVFQMVTATDAATGKSMTIPYATRIGTLKEVLDRVVYQNTIISQLVAANGNNVSVVRNMEEVLRNHASPQFPRLEVIRTLWVVHGPNYGDFTRSSDPSSVPLEFSFFFARPPSASGPSRFELIEAKDINAWILRNVASSFDPKEAELARLATLLSNAEHTLQPEEALNVLRAKIEAVRQEIAEKARESLFESDRHPATFDTFFSAVNLIGPLPRSKNEFKLDRNAIYQSRKRDTDFVPFTFRPGEIPSVIPDDVSKLPRANEKWGATDKHFMPYVHSSEFFEEMRAVLKSQGMLYRQKTAAAIVSQKRSAPGQIPRVSFNDSYNDCTKGFVLPAMAWGRHLFPMGTDHSSRMLACCGASGTGKTAFTIAMLTLIYGADGIASVNPASISKFSIGEICRRYIAVCDDINLSGKEDVFNIQWVQSWSSGVAQTVERKNVQNVETIIPAQYLMFTMQSSVTEVFRVPGDQEKTTAAMRRFVQVDFRNTIAQQNTQLVPNMQRFILPLMALGCDLYNMMIWMTRTGSNKTSDIVECAWFNEELKSAVNPVSGVADDGEMSSLFRDVLRITGVVYEMDNVEPDMLTVKEIVEGRQGVNPGYKVLGKCKARSFEGKASALWNILTKYTTQGGEDAERIVLHPAPMDIQDDASAYPLAERKVFGVTFVQHTGTVGGEGGDGNNAPTNGGGGDGGGYGGYSGHGGHRR